MRSPCESLALGDMPPGLVDLLMCAFIQDLLARSSSARNQAQGSPAPLCSTLPIAPQEPLEQASLVLAWFPCVPASVSVQGLHPLSPSLCPLTSCLGLLASLLPPEPSLTSEEKAGATRPISCID